MCSVFHQKSVPFKIINTSLLSAIQGFPIWLPKSYYNSFFFVWTQPNWWLTLLKRTLWTSFQKQQSKASNEIQLKMAKSCVPVCWLFLVFLGHLEVSFGDKCSKEEKSRLQEEHKVCTNTVQQRYSILTLDTNDLPNPLAIRFVELIGFSVEHVSFMINLP